ncbi:MAG: hypothetical protein MUP14_00100 [Dehalococcoidia bacterium]|nr:hypothetical protein [Dehalococcoidia bacterium]
MGSKLLTLIGLAAVAMAVLQGRPALADGIGVFPTEIVVEGAARGSVYYKDLGLTNDGAADIVLKPNPTGEIAGWVSVHTLTDRSTPLTELVAASGRSFFFVRIEVPGDAANGEHKGSLELQGPSGGGEGRPGSGVSVGVGVNLRVTVSGTQNLQGRIVDMSAGDTEVGYPLRVRTIFQNTGNVQANPEVEVQVRDSSSALVGDRVIGNGRFGPGENGLVTAEWDTTGRAPGDYVADARLILGGATIEERNLDFKILPVGTLTRQGVLDGLTLVNDPEPGGVAKIEAKFLNTGVIDTRALFQGEAYRGSTLVQAITTPEKLLAPGDTAMLEIFVNVPESGDYLVRGKVNFEGKETEEKELTFDVGGGGEGLPLWAWILIGGGCVVGAVVVLGGSWALARRLLRSFRL